MEERHSRLIVRAHTKGLLDYSKYRRYDIKWDIRENLIYRELVSDLDKERSLLDISVTLGGITASVPGSESAIEQFNSLVELRRAHIGILYPWLAQEKIDANTIKDAVEQWQEFTEYQKTGDFKSKMENNAKILNKKDEDAAAELRLADLLRSRPKDTSKVKGRVRF